MNPELRCGQRLHDRYCVVRLLGKGGYGAVYLVTDIGQNNLQVALKESFNNSPEAQRQFELEANLLAHLDHLSLPHVSDFFIDRRTGRQYLVMDYVEGQDLTDMILRPSKALSEQQALEWAIQVAGALAYLHSQKPFPVIHRDIKPPNIKIRRGDGRAVLVDFGIAKLYVPQKSTARIAKAFSLHFSPYEQHAGTTDERSDVYALGATLYSMVTARLAPDAFHERLMLGRSLESPRRYNRALSPALEAVIMTAMEMEPDRRFRDGLELLTALRGCQTRPAVLPVKPPPPIVVVDQGRKCPSCGVPNRVGAKFCFKCGYRLQPLSPVAVSPVPSAASPSPAPPALAPAAASPAGGVFQQGFGQLNITPKVHFELGNAFARSGQLVEALSAYRKALAGGFREPPVYHNLALVCIMAKHPEDAIPPLQEAVALWPSDPDILLQLGRAHMLLQQESEALQYLRRAAQIRPDEPETHFWLGLCLRNARQFPAALSEFEQAVRYQPENRYARFFVGRCCIDLNLYDQAEQALTEAIRLEAARSEEDSAKPDADYRYYLGLARLFNRKPEGALQAFAEALSINPNYYLAIYYSGRAYARLERWREALTCFQRAASLESRDPDPLIDMAACLALLHRRPEAISVIQQALSIDPNNQRALELLSKL